MSFMSDEAIDAIFVWIMIYTESLSSIYNTVSLALLLIGCNITQMIQFY